jgi:hypothetical protein
VAGATVGADNGDPSPAISFNESPGEARGSFSSGEADTSGASSPSAVPGTTIVGILVAMLAVGGLFAFLVRRNRKAQAGDEGVDYQQLSLADRGHVASLEQVRTHPCLVTRIFSGSTAMLLACCIFLCLLLLHTAAAL